MIFNIFIYNRSGTCLYYQEWNKKRKPGSVGSSSTPASPGGAQQNQSQQAFSATSINNAKPEDQKLMFGLLYSMKQFVQNIAPKTLVDKAKQ